MKSAFELAEICFWSIASIFVSIIKNFIANFQCKQILKIRTNFFNYCDYFIYINSLKDKNNSKRNQKNAEHSKSILDK